jgi:outer membrane protein TolC
MTLIPRRVSLLPLSLVLAAAALAADDGAVPLPERVLPALGPILGDASRLSPRMVSRALDLEIAENNRIAARSNLLPSVGLNFRQLEARDDRGDQPTTLSASKTYYDASITQPLFHWGERRNLARIGELQKLMTEGHYREAFRGLAQELRQRYLTLVTQRQHIVRARHVLQMAQQAAALAEQRLAKKEISEAMAYPIRLAVEQAQIGLERTEFDYEMARRSFARLAGLPGFEDAAVPTEIPPIATASSPIDALLAGFLAQREPSSTEAVNLRHQLAVEELTYRNQKTRLRPKFNLVAGVNQDETSYTLNTAQKYRVNSLYGGFSVSWTVFDGFASQAATRNSLARRRQVEGDYEQLVQRLGEQAQTQAKQIGFAARSMAITERAYASAEGSVSMRRDEFKRGLISEADVGAAELGLIDARIAAFNARTDYFIRVGDFLGTLAQDPAVSNLAR